MTGNGVPYFALAAVAVITYVFFAKYHVFFANNVGSDEDASASSGSRVSQPVVSTRGGGRAPPHRPSSVITSPMLHACLEASWVNDTYYYEINSDPSNDANGTSYERYLVEDGMDSFVDRNWFAALRVPEGSLSWNQGLQFADAMQSRGMWPPYQDSTEWASIVYDEESGEYNLTFTAVNGSEMEYVFSTQQCRSKETGVPTEPQEPSATPAPGPMLHACLSTLIWNYTYNLEIKSDPSNVAHGTLFERYVEDSGMNIFVDDNRFAALRIPEGNEPWNQRIQFADAMQLRGAWPYMDETEWASIVYDDESGELTLKFNATTDGEHHQYMFRTSQCK
jgi:hypothetical protein